MSDTFIAARPKRAVLPQPLPSSSDAQPYQDLGQEVMPAAPVQQPVATDELAVLEQIAMYLQQVPPPARQRILRLLTMLLP